MKNATKIEKKLCDEIGQFIVPFHAIDHHKRNGNTFVSEPYGIGKSDLKKLISICDQKGIDFWIQGDSTWNPPHTIKIVYSLEEEK